MPARARFSIIIPCFNSAAVIDGALDSVREQNWPAEVVIIDGGSSDDTIARVRSHRDLVAFHVSEPDHGIYDAINKGLPRCTGDLIGILGSDDRYAPGAFSKISEASFREPADIYAGSTLMIAPDGSTTLRPDEPYGVGALISGIPFGHNAMFATPATYDRVGPYDLKYRICADSNWVHRAIHLGLSCYTIRDVVVEFGLTGTSSTNDEEIMSETYDTIVENFPGLNRMEAKALLYAVRRWGPVDPVMGILRSRPKDTLLRQAIGCAFPDLVSWQPGAPPDKGWLRRLLTLLAR